MWIGKLTYKTKKVGTLLRLKDRAHYRVQAGAFTNLPEYTRNKEIIEKKGFPVSMVKEDNMFKIQLGYFSGKTNAERFAAKVAKKGISVFVKEIS
jgi:N-acetylmuramoyl-L-alanine amidase